MTGVQTCALPIFLVFPSHDRSGIGLKISTASTAATASTQVLMELRKTSQTPPNVGGYESTLLNVINEDDNYAYNMKAAHFEARDFAATFGKTGNNAGYGNVAILGNSKLHFFHNGVQSAYISRPYYTPVLHIVPPPDGSAHIGTGAERLISFAYRDWETDRKSTRLNSSHRSLSRMPSSA